MSRPVRGAAAEVVAVFIECINAHDVPALTACLTEDHRFIDSLGTVFSTRDTLRQGWAGYFALVSDYRVTVDESAVGKGSLILVGTAAGKSGGVSWSVPAAWRAVVRDGQIAEWQVYADNEPFRASLRV
jgi:ketosteroid isomerase-like protein